MILKILGGDIKLYYIQGGDEVKSEIPLSYLPGSKLVPNSERVEAREDMTEIILRRISF